MNANIKEFVRDGKMVTFKHYANNELWYATSCGFNFPVPISEIGNTTTFSTEKAMMFMKYMSAHLKTITKALEEQNKENE